jgi:hypothetical protein
MIARDLGLLLWGIYLALIQVALYVSISACGRLKMLSIYISRYVHTPTKATEAEGGKDDV